MNRVHTAFVATILATGLAAQNTWIVNASGTGHFTSMAAAQNAASPGDTLVLQGSMPAANTLSKTLNIVCDPGASVYGPLHIFAPGALSIHGGQFEFLHIGSTVSLDSVSTCARITSGNTLAARNCAFYRSGFTFYGAEIQPGGRALFDGCTFTGTGAAGLFGTIASTPAISIGGHAELRGCSVTGGSGFTFMTLNLPGSPAITLAGSADLRDCQLTHGSNPNGALLTGSGVVRVENTSTLGAPASITVINTQLPWTRGNSAPQGGVMTATLDGTAFTLAGMYASVGMRSPVPAPFGDVWVDISAVVGLTIGVTDSAGMLSTTIAVPAATPRGLQVTVQSTQVPTNGPFQVTPPALLQVY